MNRTIESVLDQVVRYYAQITDVQNLTSVQRANHESDLRRLMESQGIYYEVSHDDGPRFKFILSGITIVDTGIVEDVLEAGSFPIKLRLDKSDSQVWISFEPRNLSRLSDPRIRRSLSNREYLGLRRGQAYQISGSLLNCTYHPGHKGLVKAAFDLEIAGFQESALINDIDVKNLREARASGFWGALVGGLTGAVIGVCAGGFVALIARFGLRDPTAGSPWPEIIFTACTLLVGWFGYNQNFSATRRNIE